MPEVVDQVIDVFQSDRQTHGAFGNAGGGKLLVRYSEMGGGGGVDDQRFGVADVGQVRKNVQCFDKAPAGCAIASDT